MRYAVLAIDDNPQILEIVETFFREEGIPIHTARSVDEGITVLGRERIGFILLDVHMPGITGDVGLLSIRQNHPQIRIAIMSGFVDATLEKQLRDLGAIAVLHKPLRLDEVLQEARLALEFLEAASSSRLS